METQKDIFPNPKEAGLKDTIEDKRIHSSDRRAEKLITAIFMVTDLMDKSEPIRQELRSASLKLLSENHSSLIPRILSMIGIATSIGLISGMNGSIINKELSNLNSQVPTLESLSLSNEFFSKALPQGQMNQRQNDVLYPVEKRSEFIQRRAVSKGAQKTVLKSSSESKSDRRENILKLIKKDKEARPSSGGVMIKDISSQISGCSEKTIQRELISMLKDNVLMKTGEKRWSKYFIK
jgi:hypothetical protein